MMGQRDEIIDADDQSVVPARWWRATGDGEKVVCELCPRCCTIAPGKRGFCFVRANVDGRLVLTTYGRSSGLAVDPVEKKPLNHFLPGSRTMSLGTAGCNLGCKFCQNWDISKSRQMDTIARYAGPGDIVEAAIDHDCQSIALTYNDPTIWAEFGIDIAKAAHGRELAMIAVTAGYISPEPRQAFYQHIDAANVDLKAFDETFYRKLTQTSLPPVLNTLRYLVHETPVWVEITTLLIPGENDSRSEVADLTRWVVDELGPNVPVHFSAFHPDYKMAHLPRTPHETLIRAYDQAKDAGINFVYLGNVHDTARQSTYCPGCGELLIERHWHQVTRMAMRGNACASCGQVIPGRFEGGKVQHEGLQPR